MLVRRKFSTNNDIFVGCRGVLDPSPLSRGLGGSSDFWDPHPPLDPLRWYASGVSRASCFRWWVWGPGRCSCTPSAKSSLHTHLRNWTGSQRLSATSRDANTSIFRSTGFPHVSSSSVGGCFCTSISSFRQRCSKVWRRMKSSPVEMGRQMWGSLYDESWQLLKKINWT